MKRCPQCNNLFDDINDYCLNDGTPLTRSIQVAYSSQEMPTVVGGGQPQVPARSSGRLKWILPILLLSAMLVAAVGVIGFLLLTRDNNEANKPARTQQNVAAAKTPTPKPTETATKTPTSTPKDEAEYPATMRLKFNTGDVNTKYDGEINANDSRSFVLACATGQELSAVVASDDNCVEFKQGGEDYDAITSKGDNFVTIKNTCSKKTTFRIEIAVL
ncbi:MAG: hypothetical protein ACKVQW_03830 [Pyrinomonadaceae bacterium]